MLLGRWHPFSSPFGSCFQECQVEILTPPHSKHSREASGDCKKEAASTATSQLKLLGAQWFASLPSLQESLSPNCSPPMGSAYYICWVSPSAPPLPFLALSQL